MMIHIFAENVSTTTIADVRVVTTLYMTTIYVGTTICPTARYGYEKSGKEILQKAKDTGNRYVAVNLRNYHTIGFRLFSGTLKLNTLLATLQIISEICRIALLFSEKEIDKMS